MREQEIKMQMRLRRFFESPSRMMAGRKLIESTRAEDYGRHDYSTPAAVQLTVDVIIKEWIFGKLTKKVAVTRLQELLDSHNFGIEDHHRYLIPTIRYQVQSAIDLVEGEKKYSARVDGVHYEI